MGQISDYLRSVLVHLHVLKLIFKSPIFVQFEANPNMQSPLVMYLPGGHRRVQPWRRGGQDHGPKAGGARRARGEDSGPHAAQGVQQGVRSTGYVACFLVLLAESYNLRISSGKARLAPMWVRLVQHRKTKKPNLTLLGRLDILLLSE